MRKKANAGFTLIEILVVVGLIALIMSLAVPNAKMALKINIQNASRDLATTIRAAYDEAVLKGTVYRLALDLTRKEYWIERGTQDFLMRSETQEKEDLKKLERKSEEERKNARDPFSLAKSVTATKKSLPQGVQITEVVTSRSPTPITEGIVYAYIFPHGFVEKLMLHFKDSMARESTLSVNSVSGKSRVFERRVEFKDLEAN